MKSSDLRAILIAPVFLYVAGEGLVTYSGWDTLSILAFLATSIPVLELLLPRLSGRLFVGAWAAAMVTGIGLAVSVGAPTGNWASVGAGTLLGAPIGLYAGLAVWRESRGAAIVGTTAAVGALLAIQAAIGIARTTPGGTGSSGWLLAFSTVNADQIAGLIQWIQGNGAPAVPPMAAVADPVFIGLGLLAMLSVVIALLERPDYAGPGPDPWDPGFTASSGVLPLIVAAMAGLAAEYVAAAYPQYALLAVAVGVIVALALLLGLGLLSTAPRLPKERVERRASGR